MNCYEFEPYQLAGEPKGKWAITITRLNKLGVDEQPFHGGSTFDTENDALRYAVKWVASRGGRVPKAVTDRLGL
jgi:hypothetical protein